MTTMYLIVEAKWSDDNYDGYWLEDSCYLVSTPLCRTKQEAIDKIKELTKTSHSDLYIHEFHPGTFKGPSLVENFNEYAWEEEINLGSFIEWCEENGHDWVAALPSFYDYKEIEVPNVCNKLANAEKDAKIAELENKLAVTNLTAAVKAEIAYKKYVKPNKLVGDKVYEI